MKIMIAMNESIKSNQDNLLLGHEGSYSGAFSETGINSDQCNILCYTWRETKIWNSQQKTNTVKNSLAAPQ